MARCLICGAALLLLPAAARSQEPLPRAQAASIHGRLVLDGRLDEAFWQAVPAQSGFRVLSRQPGQPAPAPPEETTFRVAYDDQALLLGIVCHEPRVIDLIARVAERDGPVWSDDCVEILIQPGRQAYYQLAINSLGAQFDARQPVSADGKQTDEGKLWDGVWEAAVSKGENEWRIEARIPFATLGLGPDTLPSWRLNIGRTAGRRNEYSAWAPVENGYHDLPHFGYLDGLEVQPARYPLDGSGAKLTHLPMGSNRVRFSLPARRAGRFRVSTSLRAWAPGPLPARKAQGKVFRTAHGRLPLSLMVPVRESGTLQELIVEVADAGTGAPVLLLAHLFRAPDPFAASLEWAVYYDSDRRATAAVTLAVAPGSARGRVEARLLRGDGVPTPVRKVAAVSRPGTLRLALPFSGLPGGFYRVRITADIPDVGRFHKELPFLKLPGPFDAAAAE